MRRLALIIASVLMLVACKTVYVPVEHRVEVAVHDTTVFHKVDTLVKVPEVRLQDIVDVTDTLELRSSLALSRAWLDTTFNSLRGTLVQEGKLPVQIVERERVVYRDSVAYQEKPVPYEVVKERNVVPLFWRIFGAIGIASLAVAVCWILRRFKVL